MIMKCNYCNNEFERVNSRSKFCSETCQRKDYRERIKLGNIYIPETRNCKVCNTQFLAEKYNNILCVSDECKATNKKLTKTPAKVYRERFKEKFGLPSGGRYSEWVYKQSLLEENPEILECLKAIYDINEEASKLVKTEEYKRNSRLSYQREYFNRPQSGYGVGVCKFCGDEFNKKRDDHNFCKNKCRITFYNNQRNIKL